MLVRTPRAVFAGVLLPAILLVVRGGGRQYTAAESTLVAGLVVLGVVSTAYVTHASGLVSAREQGVLRRWWITPLPRWCFLASRVTATLCLAFASSVAITVMAAIWYAVPIRVAAVPSLAAVIAVGTLAWAMLGSAVAAFVPTAESAQPLLSLTFYPLVLLSGAFGPITGQPHWLATLVRYLPARPMVDAVHRALTPHPTFASADAGILAAWAVVGLAVAMRTFRWTPRRD